VVGFGSGRGSDIILTVGVVTVMVATAVTGGDDARCSKGRSAVTGMHVGTYLPDRLTA
jgi:hypothetical protein